MAKTGKRLFHLSCLVMLLVFSCSKAPESGRSKGPETGRKDSKTPDPKEFGLHPRVEFKTNMGTFEVTMDAEKAPKTVRTVLLYCLEGFYKGTVFHRIIPGFVVQGGGWIKLESGRYGKKEPTHPPIPNEAGNGLTHKKGAVAMARGPDPDSATCQFYVVLEDKPYLDKKRYTVFGKVTKGWEVIEKMAKVPLADERRGFPKEPPVIEDVVVRKGE